MAYEQCSDVMNSMTKSGNLLVVDDDPRNLQIMAKSLTRAGFVISVAADGAEAMERIHTGQFDIVVSDVQMPRMAGATDLKAARAAFKPLSDSLIKYLAAHTEQAGGFEKVFCSMANASWLQKSGSTVSNPYLGKAMAHCGKIEN